jgi:anaerobic magnesium-protoporphyrin IX monomethyl ester cyclase
MNKTNGRKLRALLVTSYSTDSRIGDSLSVAPPLGIISVASAAPQDTATVSCVNLMPFQNEAVIERFIHEAAALEPLDLFGVSLNISETRQGAYNIIKWFREKNTRTPIVAGGIHASCLFKQILTHFPVDYVAIGEAEETFSELCLALRNGEPTPEIQGLAFARGGRTGGDTRTRLVDNLDALPFPDLSKVDIKTAQQLFTLPISKYQLEEMKLEDGLPVESSRGCPQKCVFCGIASRPFRHHSATYIQEYLRHLNERYGFTAFTMTDDCFTLDKRRALALCEALVPMGRDITWAAQTRIDRVDAELFTALKNAGCRLISFGIESGSAKMQKNIKKNLRLNDALHTIALAKSIGINVQLFFLVGHPEETQRDLNDTIKFVRAAAPQHACFDIVKVLPGTRLAQIAGEKGFMDDSYWLENENRVPLGDFERSEKSLGTALERLTYEWFRLCKKAPSPEIDLFVRLLLDAVPPDIPVKEYFAGKSDCVVIVFHIRNRDAIAELRYKKLDNGKLFYELVPSPANRSGLKKELNKTLDEIIADLRPRLAARIESARDSD